MPKRQTALPSIWLVSDERNDAALERVLLRLPRGCGLIFRHYHLDGPKLYPRHPGLDPGSRLVSAPRQEKSGTPGQARVDDSGRRQRFNALKRIARRRQHLVALSGDPATARRWGADAAYGPASQLARGPAIPRLVTAHSLRELAAARRARADAVLLSPAFATRSHPGARALGPVKFRLLAARALVPVIALGGMNARAARRIGAARWAAVDGLCDEAA